MSLFSRSRGMSTPWGACQNKTVLGRGVFIVDTAGHGGMAISKGLALRLLSKTAIEQAAIDYGAYYWFEEDCAISIPLVDSNYILDLFCTKLQRDKSKTYEIASESNKHYFPNYNLF